MPKCPESDCKVIWQWDWEMDTYRRADTGKFCTGQEVHNAEGLEINLLKCTECNVIFSVNVLDPNWGGHPFNHQDWEGVDWEAKENSYPLEVADIK